MLISPTKIKGDKKNINKNQGSVEVRENKFGGNHKVEIGRIKIIVNM